MVCKVGDGICRCKVAIVVVPGPGASAVTTNGVTSAVTCALIDRLVWTLPLWTLMSGHNNDWLTGPCDSYFSCHT